jgi:hypothetical protein
MIREYSSECSSAERCSSCACALQLAVELVGQQLLLLLQGRVSNLAPELNLLLASLVRDMHVMICHCSSQQHSACLQFNQ